MSWPWTFPQEGKKGHILHVGVCLINASEPSSAGALTWVCNKLIRNWSWQDQPSVHPSKKHRVKELFSTWPLIFLRMPNSSSSSHHFILRILQIWRTCSACLELFRFHFLLPYISPTISIHLDFSTPRICGMKQIACCCTERKTNIENYRGK